MSIAIVDNDVMPARRSALADPGATVSGAPGSLDASEPVALLVRDRAYQSPERKREDQSCEPSSPSGRMAATRGDRYQEKTPVLAGKSPGAPSHTEPHTPRPLPHGRGSEKAPTRLPMPSAQVMGCSSPVIEDSDRTEIVDRLRKQLEDYRRRRARQAGWTRGFVSTGLAAIDAALPHGGLPCGAVTEILADDAGLGAMTLALRIARQAGSINRQAGPISRQAGSINWQDEHPIGRVGIMATGTTGGLSTSGTRATKVFGSIAQAKACGSGGPMSPVPARFVVVVDTANDFYPPAAKQHGIDLHRLIVVRVRGGKEAFWAVGQALRCRAVGAVIAPLTHLGESQSRRLQLAAESTGCVGLILRPARQRTKSFAAIRMCVTGVRSKEKHLPSHTAMPLADRNQEKIFALAGEPPVAPIQKQKFFYCHNRDAYWCRIELLTVREGMPVEPILVDLHHETGDVSVHPVPVNRPATRTG